MLVVVNGDTVSFRLGGDLYNFVPTAQVFG
jgi:hypothetical protein